MNIALANSFVSRETFSDWERVSQVTVGRLKNSEQALMALNQAGVRVGPWATEIVKLIPYKEEEKTIDLVRVQQRLLDLPDDAFVDEICEEGQSFGFELCPPEVPIQLLLDNRDGLFSNELLWVAMRQIVSLSGHRSIFNVGHDGMGRFIGANMDYLASPGDWIFALNNK